MGPNGSTSPYPTATISGPVPWGWSTPPAVGHRPSLRFRSADLGSRVRTLDQQLIKLGLVDRANYATCESAGRKKVVLPGLSATLGAILDRHADRTPHEFSVYAVLPCSDFERARAWYEQKLGLKPLEAEIPGQGWFQCADGTWFILTTSGYAGTAQNTAAGFTVTGIEGVMEELRSNGVEFLEYDMGEWGRLLTV